MALLKDIVIPSGVTVKYWKIDSFRTLWSCAVNKPGGLATLPIAVQEAYAAIDEAKKKEVITEIMLLGYTSKEDRELGLAPIYTTRVSIKQAPEAITGVDPRNVLYALAKTTSMFDSALDDI